MLAVAATSCGEKKTAEHTHDYSCSTIKEPTCTEDGESECTCSICGEKTTRVVATDGHAFGSCTRIRDPKCTETGKDDCTCSVCGFKVMKDVPATGHKFEDGKCNYCGVLKYGYKIVSVGSLNVREEPNTSSKRVGGVKQGETLLIVEIEENGEDINGNTEWIKFSFMDGDQKVYGWVPCAYLTDPVG